MDEINNTQSTERIDPDIEYLIEEDAARKRKEAERRLIRGDRNAKKAPKERPLSPEELAIQYSEIKAKNGKYGAGIASATASQPEKFYPFLTPPVISRKYVFDTLDMYMQAGFRVYPVMQSTNAYYPSCTPTTHPGLDKTELRYWLSKMSVRYYRAMLPGNIMVIDLDRGHKNGADGIREFNRLLEENGIKTGALSDIERGSYPYTTRSGSGGLHLYFGTPIGMDDFEPYLGILPGVDILTPGERRNTAIVTAGSRKANGVLYTPNFTELSGVPVLPMELVRFLNIRYTRKELDRQEKRRLAEKKYEGKSKTFSGKFKGDATPEKILKWNYEGWKDTRRKSYGGYNIMFSHSVAECVNQEPPRELEDVRSAIFESRAFREWPDPERQKISDIEKMLRYYYGKEYRKVFRWR